MAAVVSQKPVIAAAALEVMAQAVATETIAAVLVRFSVEVTEAVKVGTVARVEEKTAGGRGGRQTAGVESGGNDNRA